MARDEKFEGFEEILKAIMPNASKRNIELYSPYLQKYMAHYGINTPERQAHFLSQIAHESCQLLYNKELASGAAYDTGRLAASLGNTPEKDGDGQKYKGRGLIQITGKFNYGKLSKDWGIDAISNPDILLTPENSARSACWFWWKNGLNKLVDSGATVEQITRKVNGGENGLKERMTYYDRAKKVIN